MRTNAGPLVVLWYAAGAVAIVWAVFQSPMIDYRMVAIGALFPLLEAPWGNGVVHSLLFACVALAAVMFATIGRRLVRRRWLGLVIGVFLHLVLDGTWDDTKVFWWPLAGRALYRTPVNVVERGLWSVLLELAGVALASWVWREFGLADPQRRARFVRTGQLDRSFVKPPKRFS